MTTIPARLQVDLDDLAHEIVHAPGVYRDYLDKQQTILEFIKSLDASMADWEFTKALHAYTSQMMEELAREEQDDVLQ